MIAELSSRATTVACVADRSTTHAAHEFAQSLRAAWSRDTSADPAAWAPDNPAWGQCAVTALIVQDRFGGQLLRCETATGSHYFNRLPDGTELDLTCEQFPDGITPQNTEVRYREHLLGFEPTRRRYETLSARITRLP